MFGELNSIITKSKPDKKAKAIPESVKPARLAPAGAKTSAPKPTAVSAKLKSTSSSTSNQAADKKSFDPGFLSEPKILYVGDSVGHTASLGQLEIFQNCRIKSAKAYSSVYDKRARWPKYNFSDVVG